MRKKGIFKENMRIDTDSKQTIDKLRRELQNLENNQIPQGEIIRRILRDQELYPKLKRGSLERRMGFRK